MRDDCPICGGSPASMKIGEEISQWDNGPPRHNLTMYICGACFVALMTPPVSEFELVRIPKRGRP